MQQFRRSYRLLERLFQRSGAQDQFHGPGLVDETVMPVWQAMKPRPGDVLFDSRALTGNSAAPGTFQLATTAAGNATPAGRVRIYGPGAVFNGDVAARIVQFGIVQRAGVTVDPWGSWWTLAGGSRVTGGLSVAAGEWATTPPFPLWFNDTDLFANFLATTGAGENFQWHFCFIDVPGELVDVEIRP